MEVKEINNLSTQHTIRDGKFVEEFTLWNDLAIRKRLYLARNGLLAT